MYIGWACDASENGKGGVLLQSDYCGGPLKVLFSVSHSLSPTEMKGSTLEREL